MAVVVIIAAVLGASVGAFMTYQLQRARPAVQIDNITTSNDHSSATEPVEVNVELIEKLIDFGGSFDLDYPAGVIDEQKYVTTLDYIERQLKEQIDVYFPRLVEFVDRLRVLVISRDWSKFDFELARTCIEVWRETVDSILRGRFSFGELTYEGEGEYEVLPDEDGEGYIIPQDGVRNIVFLHEHLNKVGRNKVDADAKRFAEAVSHRDHEAVLKVIDFLRNKLEADRTTAEVLLSDTRKELAPFARITVEGSVLNRGRTPVSFSTKGKLVVFLKGFRNSATVVEDDVDVALNVGALIRARRQQAGRQAMPNTRNTPSQKKPQEYVMDELPMSVPPGQAVRFRAVSELSVSRLPNSEELSQVFTGGNQKTYLALGAITQKNSSFQPVYSPDVLFRDLAHTVSLPRKSSKG